MKKISLIVALAALLIGVGFVVGQNRSTEQDMRRERHEMLHKERVAERERRTQEYVRFIDSIVLARSFNFNPQTMQRQPAGMMHQLYNPNFILTVYPDYVDVYLPFIQGIMPPYHYVVWNYALPGVNGYVAVQNDNGWTISFKSWLYSSNEYTFTLNIFSQAGTAVLDISSDLYNTVSYSGSITKVY